MKKAFAQSLLLVWLCTAIDALAYNEGGHYYTLLALFDSHAHAVPESKLRDMKLQGLCSELPDMAEELDAITQRVRVLKSWQDYLWGLSGQCQTTVSSHMVATQYYLHGLSGAPADRIRNAAKIVLNRLDDDLAGLGTGPSQARRNLICARSFAAHLYGDTFAHVRLSSERPGLFSRVVMTEMYQTGLGHVRDGHDPDYLYGHRIDIDKWPRWVLDAAIYIATGADPARVLDTHRPCRDSLAACEEPARQRLEDLLTMKEQLMVTDMPQRNASGRTGIGGMERATTCDEVVSSIFPDANDRPQCDIAWKTYLDKAIRVFHEQGIDPSARPDAKAGKSCTAWRCSGSTRYNGEAPNTCTVDIVDELSFGREQP